MTAETDSITRSKDKKIFHTIDITYIGAAVALITVCSWISIPTTIPFTLQTFAVMLAVLLLGGMRGTIAITVYILLGAVGVPVFSGFTGGIARLMGPTGGYIIGFLGTALVMWAFEKILGKKLWVYITAIILGLVVCYTFGTMWFIKLYTADDGSKATLAMALSACVIPYLIPEVIKVVLALTIGTNKAVRNVIQ
ncbi:MAG: biotin transporter BioY [Lachnospiraceae bacterium]|nr:biotin transporter BioY [Lachnospiraceae bacterium]